jgi:hypothetical protein
VILVNDTQVYDGKFGQDCLGVPWGGRGLQFANIDERYGRISCFILHASLLCIMYLCIASLFTAHEHVSSRYLEGDKLPS